MTTFHPWRTAAILAVGWLMGWGAVSSQASEIRDDGKFFSPEVVTKATEDLNRLEKRSRLEARIETYETIPEDKREAFDKLTSKEERDRFYLRWLQERAKTEGATGVFILITRKPGHLDVEMSNAIKRRGFGISQRNEIRDILVKNFKVEKFDDGLKEAVARLETISLRLGEARQAAPVATHQAQAPHRRAPVGAPAEGQGGGMGIWGWIILAVVVMLVFSVISAIIRGLSGGNRGQPGYGQPGYGQGGYGYGGGGGFFGNMLGGVAGAMAGNWLYDSMSGGHHGQAHAGDWTGGSSNAGYGSDDYGGSDFGSSDFGGGDFGGGDFGGDSGGGGGDF